MTGAARGLGLEIARGLVGRRYDVCIADLDEPTARNAADQIGGGSRPKALDVRDAEACRAAAREVVERSGELAVWVNNAGILRTRPAWEHPEAELRALFDVNVHGVMNGTLAALEPMRAARRGDVINVISLAGLAAPPGETVYAATKHAALAFTVGTLLDLRQAGYDGIHLSALCPDGIWTPMLYDKVHDPQAAPSWSGVLLHPEEVARHAVALLDRPRPVLSVPRWRGGVARLFAAAPRAGVALAPRMMEQARRRQQAWVRRVGA